MHPFYKRLKSKLLQRSHDQKHHVSAMSARFPHLVRRHDEVLAQNRHIDFAAHRVEVGQRAAESAFFR